MMTCLVSSVILFYCVLFLLHFDSDDEGYGS